MVSFFKYHGLGNDFVLLDGLTRPLPVEALVDPRRAALLCDRHRGVGADGLVLLLPPTDDAAQVRMRIINADGSEAEMCGNGIRCAAKALHDHVAGFERSDSIAFATGAGLLRCDLSLGADGLVSQVRVDMGRPSVQGVVELGAESTLLLDKLLSAFLIDDLRAEELRPIAVSMGNPHLVSFPETSHDLRQVAEALGGALEKHPRFPNRTNVEFARPRRGGGLDLWVWERGCGITQACGTGACATAVAAVETGRHPPGQPLSVHLPGGTLTIEVADRLERVWMTGPAEEVFSGELVI